MEEVFTQIEEGLRKRYYKWDGQKQFEGTAARLLKVFEEMCRTPKSIDEELKTHFAAAYTDSYDELLVEGPIKVWTLCPHHLMPCKFSVHIGYIPDKRVLGLSKLTRVAVLLGKRPVIQEMYSKELARAILLHLKPKGVGVFVVGEHGCMRARGVGQDASVTTSVLSGTMEHPERRAEFMSIVRGGNGR